jgi:hypothetical protein
MRSLCKCSCPWHTEVVVVVGEPPITSGRSFPAERWFRNCN